MASDSVAMSTQMNTRIEAALKRQGDAVLERFGITPSQAIRGLWRYLSFHNDIPEYMKEQRRSQDDERWREARALAQHGEGLALRLAHTEGLVVCDAVPLRDVCAMEDAMYEEMLDDYHAYCR